MTVSRMIRRIIFILLFVSMCFLDGCKNDNINIEVNQKNSYANSKDTTDNSSDDIYTKLSKESVIETINNYYVNWYRNAIIRGVGTAYYEGKELSYDVYYVGDNYLLVKFKDYEDEDLYKNATFYINKDLTVVNKRILDYDKLDSLYKMNLIPIYSGSFYIPKKDEIVFKEYEGKKELLKQLEQFIWYRYFDYSKDKPASDYPIFYETEKTTKVELLDFDKITTIYRTLVYTDDGYVYEVNIKYNKTDQRYVAYESTGARYKVEDVLNYENESNSDAFFADFVGYYNFAKDHIISNIDETYK